MLLRTLLAIPRSPRQEALKEALGSRTVVSLASDELELWTAIRADAFDLAILSTDLLADEPRSILQSLRRAPRAPDVVLVAQSDSPECAAYYAAGCLAVLDRELSSEDMIAALNGIVARASSERVSRVVARARVDRRLDAMGTRSSAIRRFQDVTRRIAASDSPVLIQGEPGTGKTWLGPVIHRESPRAGGPFHSLRCNDAPEEVIESALFGHAAGALPGLPAAGRGLMERAHGGTLFLERIDGSPLGFQEKLVRYLDTREWRRVGGHTWMQVDVRLLASVKDQPGAHADAGALHPELYRRIGLVGLSPPPLRDRPEDIPELATSAHRGWRARYGLAVDGFTSSAMNVLQQHTWPGNVSELWSVVERSMLLSRGDRIAVEDLPLDLQARPEDGSGDGWLVLDAPWLHDLTQLPTLRELRAQALEVVERAYVAEVLRAAGGRVAEAARRAGVDPRSLYERMRRYGLRKEDYKPPRLPRRRRSQDS